MPSEFARAEGRLEATVMEALRAQLDLIHDMSRRIETLEQHLERSSPYCVPHHMKPRAS
jgi:hypothetical protein